MIQTYAHQKELREARIDIKSPETAFSNIIVSGTNCSPFESEIILQKAKEIFGIGEYSQMNLLQPGQLIWTAVDIKEPPGKPLQACHLQKIILTYLKADEDNEVRRKYGTSFTRQQQIQRMTVEAMDQGALLSQEDLAQILGADVRTIRRDIQMLRTQRGILAPTRGQQKDIGPGVTHRIKAVTLFLDGKQPLEIAREIKHSLTAVERYINTFCRVVYCQEQFHDELKTALVVGISTSAVRTYLDLYQQVRSKDEYKERIEEIEKLGLRYYQHVDFKKKPGLTKRRAK